MFFKGDLSGKKIKNILGVSISLMMKNPHIAGYPIRLMIEPTNLCNLKCPLCPTGNGTLGRPKGKMSLSNYKMIIDQVGEYVTHIYLWNYGEPFINKDIFEMVSYAKRKKIYVAISTNGHFLNTSEEREKLINSHLDNLIVALDGASEETFKKYRRQGSFSAVTENLKALILKKREMNSSLPLIEIQFIVMKHNQHEIGKIKEVALRLGADKLTLKFLGIGDPAQNIDPQYLPDEKFIRSSFKKRKNDKLDKNGCPFLWMSSVIDWDGDVVPCCYDPHANYKFGNLFTEGLTFKEIWNGKKYIDFRKRVLHNKKSIPICASCPRIGENLSIKEVNLRW